MKYIKLCIGLLLVWSFSPTPASEPYLDLAEPTEVGRLLPIISISPDTLWDTLFTTGTSTQAITISNLDTLTQTFDIVVDYNRPQAPSPLASWPTQRMPIIEDFEDGAYDGWTEFGFGVHEVTDTTAGEGLRSFYSLNDHFEFSTGIYKDLDPGTQIERFSFYVRPGSVSKSDADVSLNGASFSRVIRFTAGSSGQFIVNLFTTGDTSFTYSANTWYLVEFLNIDWNQKQFDYFVNGALIKADIPFLSSGANDAARLLLSNPNQTSEAWWDEVRIGGPDWLSVQSDSLTVVGESNLPVSVNFDATNLPDGDSVAYIIVSARPPSTEQDTVTVLLHVTAAPDIELSADTLDFGTLFVGNPLTDTLEIFNSGTDTLQVLLITSTHPDFTPGVSGVTVAPFEFQPVPVTFTPSDTGSIVGSLTIASDDPDEPVLNVELVGTGIERPIIGVTAAEFYDSLVSYDSSSHIFTISNTGQSDLYVDISVFDVTPLTGSPSGDSLALIPFHDDFEDGDVNGWLLLDTNQAATTTSQTSAQGSFSFHDDSSTSGIIREFEPGLTTDMISAWVRSGSDARNDAYIQVRASNQYTMIDFFAQTNGVFRLNGSAAGTSTYEDSTWYHISFRDILFDTVPGFPGSFDFYIDGRLIKDSVLFTSNADDIGSIRLHSGGASDESWWDDVRLGNAFVFTDTTSAIIPPATQVNVTATFKSTNLPAGNYAAEIHVSSNDSSDTPIIIPAYLNVAGIPNIGVQPDSIYFDSVLVGDSAWSNITVTNAGTTLLQVTNIAAEEPEWTANPTSFDLGPGASQVVDIDFVPVDSGLKSAILTITSNADTEPSYEVTLGARAIEPRMLEFVGVCPVDGHMYEGGGFAIQLQSRIDSASFQSLNIFQIKKNGSIMLPNIGPTMTGLDQIGAPSAPRMIMYWEASPGEAGTWEFCFRTFDNLNVADTFCTEVIVDTAHADHVYWHPHHIKYNSGDGPFEIGLDFSSLHGHDSTWAITFPFILSQEAGGAFINQALAHNDFILPAEYDSAFGSISINLNIMDAVAPDSFLVGLLNFGDPALVAGGPYTSSVSATLRDEEGIIRIDTTLLLPANRLNYLSDPWLTTVTPTYSPGCFPVTIGPPCSVTLTGDANETGDITSSDIIFLVAFIFKGGAIPEPCIATGDVNCDGAVTASDLIYLVNFVFKGGPAPCDVCTLSPNIWTCP